MAKKFWGRWPFIVGAIVIGLILIVVVPSPGTSVGAFLFELVRRSPDPRPELHTEAPFLVIGHRGAAGYEVENTLPSVQRAIQLGANAVEIDLCMTADSVIILWHDWDPDDAIAKVRERGGEPDVLHTPHFPESDSPHRKPMNQLTLETIRQHYGYELKDYDPDGVRVAATIPTLDEFMTWAVGVDSLLCVYLDLKIPEDDSLLAPAVIARIKSIVSRYQPRFATVYLTPYEPVLRAIDPLLEEGTLSYDLQPPPGVILDPCSLGSVEKAIRLGNRDASYVVPITSTIAPWTTVRRIIECDLEDRKRHNQSGKGTPVERVMVATLNDNSKIETLIGLGVNGIITDFPDTVRRIYNRLGQAQRR